MKFFQDHLTGMCKQTSDGEKNFRSICEHPHAFLVCFSYGKCVFVRRSPFSVIESFVHAQTLERTKLYQGNRWMYGSHVLAYVSHVLAFLFVLNLCVP